MNNATCRKLGATLAGMLAIIDASARADSFGSGANAFALDFAEVGSPGNADDAGAGGGRFSSPFGGVAYGYRMGVTKVPQDWITKATNSGMTNVTAGAWTGMQPAAFMQWYEAAAFVNWLNTSTGHQAAYDLSFSAGWRMALWSSDAAWDNDPGAGQDLNLYRHKDAAYFLPSEDEWYKTAFHKADGATGEYWDYATGSNAAPIGVLGGRVAGTAVYDDPYRNPVPSTPAEVDNTGGLSPCGTQGQGGNVFEWLESAFTGPNDAPSEDRAFRGGNWNNSEINLRSSARGLAAPTASNNYLGFRVASVSVPEPSSALLLMGSGFIWLLRRRRATGR